MSNHATPAVTLADSDLPKPEIRHPRRGSFSLVWVVPIVAALIGLTLLIRSLLSAGTHIEVTFRSAESLQSGKTEVRYKDVVVGVVRGIHLADDLQNVVVNIEMTRQASKLAVEDSRFWVVKPRIDQGGVSGLGTLVSGAYISIDVGHSSEARREFVGLETPPVVTNDEAGTSFALRTTQLGSLGAGAPIYFRQIPVGRVGNYELDDGGRTVTLRIFIDSPYDKLVTADTRFWNASGVDVSLSAAGVKVSTESLVSILSGGIAFETLEDAEPAREGQSFWLNDNREMAMAPPSGRPVRVRMRFAESVRGLSVGAPVDLNGVAFGDVESVVLDYDEQKRELYGNVIARLFPQRLGKGYERLKALLAKTGGTEEDVLMRLLEEGLHAQLKTGNLLTGQLYVALEIPSAQRRRVQQAAVRESGLLVLPTERGSLAQMQTQVAEIVDRLSRIPFAELGQGLRDSITGVNRLLTRLDSDVTPAAVDTLDQARRTLESASQALRASESTLKEDARQTLYELERAGRSLRGLTDFLQRNPQSLLRGKRDAADPQPREDQE
ncbi:intermembrane transport protein PqiB [Sinimarinibacterium sp. NLF-5-8]|uniref:PqiB family protein n=1 Tax=Sinimarinibacterium sp. NLF-5-8 TaxID=2698684 RepID=UPI00137C33D6|nr:MlaD family protein [Sinimarinibacterium sp. NLF-5-8]QHS09690.1 MCE family protein [Sinimarinibacterium sp. NLF-5-8]